MSKIPALPPNASVSSASAPTEVATPNKAIVSALITLVSLLTMGYLSGGVDELQLREALIAVVVGLVDFVIVYAVPYFKRAVAR